jgi:hypothetical protein
LNSLEELNAYYKSLLASRAEQNMKKLENKDAPWHLTITESDDNDPSQDFDVLRTIETQVKIHQERAEWLSIIKTAFLGNDQDTMMKFLPKYLGIENESN